MEHNSGSIQEQTSENSNEFNINKLRSNVLFWASARPVPQNAGLTEESKSNGPTP